MPFRNEIIFLTFLVIALAIFASLVLSLEKLVAYGTVFAAAGGFVAIFWFAGSLYYQSIQIKEQREQFNVNFSYLKEDAKRKAIILAKEMLADAEEKAIKAVDGMEIISKLPTLYAGGMVHWKTIIKSNNPAEVLASFQEWLPLEGSAITLVSGVKNAAEIYFKSLGKVDIDYSKNPEEFLFIYAPLLREAPYFQTIIGIADMVAQSMFSMSPGRATCLLAGTLSMALTAPPRVVREDKIHQDIEEHIKKGYPIPAIVDVYHRSKRETNKAP